MVRTSLVKISGRGTGVDFTIDDAAPFDQVMEGLRECLSANRGLWSSGAITVNLGRRILTRDQFSLIKRVVERESGLTVTRFWCSPETLEAALSETVGVGVTLTPPIQSTQSTEQPIRQPMERPLIHNWIEAPEPRSETPSARRRASGDSVRNERADRQADALLVKTTCRSGKSVHHAGDVVVLGDVNPGAEIVAEGDIVVFGTLRGLAHAGAAGDAKAAIVALRLEAPRIQIGPFVAVAASEDQRPKSTDTGPKIAYVQRRSIYVAPFAGRFAKYSRGILYDG